MTLLPLALRNLSRNRRRTLLTLAAMVASSSLLILSLGVFSGMFVDMLASVTEQYSGHLVVAANGYLDEHDLYLTTDADTLPLADWRARPFVRGAAPRLRGFGLLSHGDRTRPVEALGIVPAAEANVTRYADDLVAGHYLADDDRDGLLLGRSLAQRLGVDVGDTVVYVTQAADGSIGNGLLQVRGIFQTGSNGHDNNLALVPLPWLQEILVLPGQVHEVALTITDPLDAPARARALARDLPPGLEVRDWGQLLPEMAEVVASYGASTLVLSLILYAAAGLGIVNTLYMSVLERTREFGLLLAMGLRPWQVRRLVLLESLLLGLVAVVVGAALGFVLSLAMKYIGIDLSAAISPISYAGGTILPRLHAELELANFLTPCLLLVLTSVAAGWLPARRAARLQPAAALRED